MPSIRPLAVSGALLLAACDSSNSLFDPQGATQSAGEVIAALEESPAFQSLSVLGADITINAPSPVVNAALPDGAFARGALAQWARAAVSELAAGEIGEAMAPIFPSDLLGKTFTYDLAETRYEVSTETGAPATGVRFILYAVDPVLRRVTTPLTAVGHLDLTDESTAAAAVLGVKVVISNVTLLDYDAIASIATESVSFEAQGSISDGQATVEFDLIQGITSGPTIALDYQLAVPESGVALGLVASITTANSDIILTVEHEGGTTVIRAEGDEDAITGTVTHDGIVVVTIAGSPDQPDFTDPSGNALSAEQLEALHRLFEHTDRLLDAFDDLLDPAHRLLGIPL